MSLQLIDRISGRLDRAAAWFDDAMSQIVARRPARLTEGKKLVSFTFDDFPQTAAEDGASILEDHGAKGTFFANFGLLGKERACGRAADLPTIVGLAQRGHEIGCHTYAHLDLSRTSTKDLSADLEANHAHAAAAGVDLQSFAYPFGKVSSRNKSIVAQRFQSARGIGWWRADKIIRGEFDAANLPACPLDCATDYDGAVFPLLDGVAENGGWLIFVLHDVRAEPSRWGVTPTQLRRLLCAVAERGIELAPIRDALKECRRDGNPLEGA